MGTSLEYLYSTANDMLKEAAIYRKNKNVTDLYVMLLRFISLLTVNIPSHRDYQTCCLKEKVECEKKLSTVLVELEELKPVMQHVNEQESKLGTSSFLAESRDVCLKQLLSHSSLNSGPESIRGIDYHEMPNFTRSNSVQESPHGDGNKLCGICLEEKSDSEMFRSGCSHSFCLICTTMHITHRLNEKLLPIMCPKPNCRQEMQLEHCKSVLSQEVIEKWGLVLAESTIPDSQKCYCPYPDCGSLLINGEPNVIIKTQCPQCCREFCARCRVPWHKGINCSKFEKSLKRKDENEVFQLARINKWKQCGQCKSLVERISGCHHMTCRCGYQFCYKCGSKWMTCNLLCRWRRWLGDG